MDPTLLRTLVQVESNSIAHHEHTLPAAPERVVSRTYPAVPQQDPIELQSLRLSRNETAPSPSAPATPREETDLEMSAPATPAEPADAVDALPTLNNPPKNKFRLASCCFQNFLSGLIDSAAGALIPHMEIHYNIGYAVVSLLFIGNALGYIMAAPFVDQMRQRLGRARAMALSQALIAAAFAPFVSAAPFPAVAVGYFFIGFGCAVQLAICNVFCANLRRGTTMLGAMHGSYGVGGTLGPLVATALVAAGAPWNYYYFLTLAIALFNLAFSSWSFAHYEAEQADAAQAGSDPSAAAAAGADFPSRSPAVQQMSAMLVAFSSRVVLLGAIFIFAYQGAEVSISGWVISFLIAARDGDPSTVGYVTSGFWGGITLGRFLLSPVGARVGEKLFVYVLVVGAAVFQLLVWWVPNIVGEAVSVAVVGLLLGPVWPCAAVVFMRNLSRREQVSGLSVVSAFGSSGGAVAPFTTGILAQAAGTFVLHPIAIALFAVMVLCWFGLPGSIKRRTE
ncbi:MFS general substrate transporter [Durotheca rogersii]|uniref:MFS general substrate transporter n=1 Tax=Durotheca rogersii TaxID=419775 RepID=UPI002220AF59|nr:MFS general substrate transporter [Durotheca rogersii]KAI5868697.1 MFS general substrate transporter [Durotheca rogersii]